MGEIHVKSFFASLVRKAGEKNFLSLWGYWEKKIRFLILRTSLPSNLNKLVNHLGTGDIVHTHRPHQTCKFYSCWIKPLHLENNQCLSSTRLWSKLQRILLQEEVKKLYTSYLLYLVLFSCFVVCEELAENTENIINVDAGNLNIQMKTLWI